jgi:hypothetical protein
VSQNEDAAGGLSVTMIKKVQPSAMSSMSE